MDFMCYKGKENSIETYQGEENNFNGIEYTSTIPFGVSVALVP